jgi:hypothetical protein
MAKRRGPDLEWWVECWGWEKVPAEWEFHSIHPTKLEAYEAARAQLERFGGRWRVVEVARYQLEVLT